MGALSAETGDDCFLFHREHDRFQGFRAGQAIGDRGAFLPLGHTVFGLIQ